MNPPGPAIPSESVPAGDVDRLGAAVQPWTATRGWLLPGSGVGRLRRLALWGALLALLTIGQGLLLALTVRFEAERAQDEAHDVAAETATELKRGLLRGMQGLQGLALDDGVSPQAWASAAAALVHQRQGIIRVEVRDNQMQILKTADAAGTPPLFVQMGRGDLEVEAVVACAAARRQSAPVFSRSYYVPLPDGLGHEVMDLCIPLQQAGRAAGYVVGSISLVQALEAALPARQSRRYEVSLVEPDGTRLAREGALRGVGTFVAHAVVDLPGSTFQLRANSVSGRPSLVPNLATALVLGLSVTLFALVLLLARDGRRRSQAEQALAESLAFRKAMEDSLSTGLRARDLQGRVTYANPAFCAMVGFSSEELQAAASSAPDTQPYWPPESAREYQGRQKQRLSGSGGRPAADAREGFETLFMRKSGERFPVMIYETPLVNGEGRHTGWMSAVVDLSAQRRIDDLARQQQERLQATARLATVGEMASLLSHELNQPLAAISSYASGSLNLLEEPDAATPGLLRQGLQRITEQAERAGRVIQSVHNFVRRREHQHETLSVDLLLEAVLPLVRLQARKSGARIEIDIDKRQGKVPRVRCDRTMVEQVLLNLTRNGIQAMETDTDPAQRVLTLQVRHNRDRWVMFSVIDLGPGVPADVAAKLFTPFFTTRAEGMGLGLSLCRTVIEQHGGALDFGPGPAGKGTEFRFTLPAGRVLENSETPLSATPV